MPFYLDFDGHFGCPKRLPKSIKKPPEISSNFGYISGPILGRILAAFGLRFGLQKCIKCSMKEPSFSCTGSTNSSLQASPGTSRKWLQNSIDFQSQKVSQNGSQKAPRRSPKTTLKTSRKMHQKNVEKMTQKINPFMHEWRPTPPSQTHPPHNSQSSNTDRRNGARENALPVILPRSMPTNSPFPNL